MKRIQISLLAIVLASVITLTGCGQKDEKTRLKEATVDIACNLVKKMTEDMKNIDFTDEEAMKKIEEESKNMETKMEEMLKKHGFENEKAFEEAGGKYEEDKAFKDQVAKAVKDKCDFDFDLDEM